METTQTRLTEVNNPATCPRLAQLLRWIESRKAAAAVDAPGVPTLYIDQLIATCHRAMAGARDSLEVAARLEDLMLLTPESAAALAAA